MASQRGAEPIDFSGMTPGEIAATFVSTATTLTGSVARLEKSRMWSRVAMGALALVGTLVFGLVVGLYVTLHYVADQAQKRDDQIACLQSYLNDYVGTAVARSNATTDLTVAIDSVFATLKKRPFDQAAFDAALAVEFRESAQNQKIRDENPLPPLARVVCS